MEKVLQFFKKYKNPIKYCFIFILLILSFYAIRLNLKEVKVDDLREIAAAIDTNKLILFFAAGLFAFGFQMPYDLLLAKKFDINLKNRDIFEISWICQSFNNFIGIAGITGVALRSKLYINSNVDNKKALKIALIISFSSMVGLFYMGLLGIYPLLKQQQYQFVLPLVILFILGILYLFMDKIPISWIQDREWIKELSLPLRIRISAVSVLEWAASAFYFLYALKLFQPEVTIGQGVVVYIIATIIGLVSMIPGSLGSFDGAVLILLGNWNYSDTNILFGLLLFRIGYTLIPWIIGVLLLALRNMRNKDEIEDAGYYRNLRKVLGTMVLFSGLLLGLSVATPEIFTRIHLLHAMFPKLLPIISNWITLFLGILLIVLSKGIFSGVRRAYYATLIVLILAAAACLMKGLDYEEAIIMLIIALGLFSSKKAFEHPSIPLSFKNVAKVSAAVLAAIFLFVFVFNQFAERHYDKNKLLNINFAQQNLSFILLFLTFVILIGLALIFTNRKYLENKEITAEEWETFEKIKEKYPNSSYTYLVYMKDKNIFFNEKKTVAILYGIYKEHIMALGDPIGAEEDIEDAIDEMVMWAEQHNMDLTFYEAGGVYLEKYINNGFRFLKLGEDALVNLEEFKTTGKHGKSFRQALNNMEEEKLSFKVYDPPFSAEFMESLKEVSEEWLHGRKEMGFSLGAFKEDYLNRSQMFTIEDEKGEVIAFANRLEMKNTNICSIDLMRYKEKGIHGLMEMLLISIIQWGKEQGYQYFDLGIAPLSNVGNKPYSGGKEKAIHLAYQYGNRIYGFIGLRQFKQKIHPEWKNVYIAYKEDRLLPEILLDLSILCHKEAE